MGIMWSDFEALTVSLTGALATLFSLSRRYCGAPESKGLQQSGLESKKKQKQKTGNVCFCGINGQILTNRTD